MNKHEPAPKVREVAVFKSNRSQAIRIPKELAFPERVTKVTITPAEGGGLLIRPKQGKDWAAYFANGPFVDDDFLADRNQGVAEEREPLD
jgi:antitoxin VapB